MKNTKKLIDAKFVAFGYTLSRVSKWSIVYNGFLQSHSFMSFVVWPAITFGTQVRGTHYVIFKSTTNILKQPSGHPGGINKTMGVIKSRSTRIALYTGYYETTVDYTSIQYRAEQIGGFFGHIEVHWDEPPYIKQGSYISKADTFSRYGSTIEGIQDTINIISRPYPKYGRVSIYISGLYMNDILIGWTFYVEKISKMEITQIQPSSDSGIRYRS